MTTLKLVKATTIPRGLDRQVRQYAELLAGHDEGLWSLPEEIVDAAAALAHLNDSVPEEPQPAPAAVRDQLVGEAARTGQLPALDDLFAAQTARRVHGEVLALINDARRLAANLLHDLIVDMGDVIITDHLRPAHDLLAARAGDLAGNVGSTDPALVLRTDDESRTAYLEFVEVAQQLQTIVLAAGRLRGDRDLDRETTRWLHGRNVDEVAPGLFGGSLNGAFRPPWPTEDLVSTLHWQLTHGLELWLPTARELAARSEEYGRQHNTLRPVTKGHIGRYVPDRGDAA